MATTAPKLADVLGKTLTATGQDIPEGNYPGILFAFGDPFMLPVAEQFRKPGKPLERAVMELHFGVRVKEVMASVGYLCPVPEGGATNKKSNLYKALKALKGSDPKVFDKDGLFVPGVTLQGFIGATATVQVKKNKKDFPQIETLSSAMDGVKYPSMEETAKLVEELKETPVSDGDVPF